MTDATHALWEQAVVDENYDLATHLEARKYFEDFELDGYRVGEVKAYIGNTLLVREVDYFSSEAQAMEREIPRDFFPAALKLALGTRYAISHFTEDLARDDGKIYARNNVTRINVYEGDTIEADSLHATILPIPKPAQTPAPRLGKVARTRPHGKLVHTTMRHSKVARIRR